MDWKRIFLITLFTLIVVVLSFLVFGYISFRRSLPQTFGQLEIASLRGPVQVWRDEWSVPHIVAQNDTDLFVAAGFVTAQDRLWQMDLFRRAASGRLSEIFGKRTLEADKLARTIGFRRIATDMVSKLPQANQALLSAYADGVNSYVKLFPKQLPIEFGLLRYKPESWKAEDSLAILRLLGWFLSMGWHVDLVYGELLAKFGPEKVQELVPFSMSNGETILPKPLVISSRASESLRLASAQWKEALGYVPNGIGSNSWVVTGSRTRSTLPLLANDTHLHFSAPDLFYLIHLSSSNINAIGVSIAGLPSIVIGRNVSTAWGLTNGMIDDVDFYQEQVDSTDSTHYILAGQSLPFAREEEVIPVLGQEPYKLTIRSTRNGPIISEIELFGQAHDSLVSMRWAGREVGDEFSASVQLLRAQDWQDFIRALQSFKTPGQNVIYADTKGNIGYCLAAAVPLRRQGQGLFPGKGDLYSDDWRGYLPNEELPKIFNPPGNVIVTANNPIGPSTYPFYLSSYWEPDYRFRRIVEMLDSLESATADSFVQLQRDVCSPQAAALLPKTISILQRENFDRKSNRARALVLLRGWDFRETSESIPAAIFEVFYLNLFRYTFADEMGDSLFARFLRLPHGNMEVLDRMMMTGASEWFDDVTTPDSVESLSYIVKSSFTAAIDTLEKRFGADMGQWRWGRLHSLTFRHPFGMRRSFARIFNIGPFKSDGGCFTINNGTFLLHNAFENVVGACMRQVVDMSTVDYHVILTTGQSGHPLSKHYRDQSKLWLNGELIRLSLDIDKLKNRKWKLLTLSPARGK